MSLRISNTRTIISNGFAPSPSQSNYARKSADYGHLGQNQEKESTLRKMETEQRQQAQRKSIIDQSKAYAEQLKASRTKAKDSSLEKKKLQYSFKKISSQIIRSKDSMSARRAVQAAKREISRLKRLKGSGEYDDEELQLAIDHAKAMEKVAKKKANHLEQEEMIERNGKGLAVDLEEIEKENGEETQDNQDEEMMEESKNNEDWLSDISGSVEPTLEEYEYEMQLRMEELAEELSVSAEEIAEAIQASNEDSMDSMSEMMEDMTDAMNEMMEEMDLTDLAESLYAPDPDMSEEDLKMLKIKHRAKEMKAIAEADKEYLKGIMEHEKNKAASLGAMSGASSSSSSFGNNEPKQITPIISMPGAAAGGTMVAPTTDGGFDVSI